jgi:hypothetical protein
MPIEKLIGFFTMMGKPFAKHEANVITGFLRLLQGVCHHTMALPFTLKSILRQKKKLKYFTMQKYT